MDCTNLKRNLNSCTCTYPGCPRKGVCCECIAYHRAKAQLPGCLFDRETEATFDRSVQNFVSRRK